MKNKLSYLGVGPKIGGVAIPWLAVTIIISQKYKPQFEIAVNGSDLLFFSGMALVLTGMILYFFTLPLLLKGLKENKLITTGAFSLCRNPLYAAFIIFLLPGIGLAMNSWLVLTTCLLSYILFKIFINNEYVEMSSIFGDEYKEYSSGIPELFPFPFKKWFRQLR